MASGTDSLWNSTNYWSEPAERAFAAAWRKGRRQMILDRLRGRNSAPITFRDVTERSNLLPESRTSVRVVDVDRIIGSVGGRGYYFTRSFYPKNDVVLARWKRAFAVVHGFRGYEPVELYEVAGGFYVVDGHFRVSVARALGYATIEATVRRWA